MPKRQEKTQKKLKQASLLNSFSSSPTRPSPEKPQKRRKKADATVTATKKRKQRSPSAGADESDSDVGAIHFQPRDDDADKSMQPSSVKRRKTRVLDSDDGASEQPQPVVKRRLKKTRPSSPPPNPVDLSSEDERPARKPKSRLKKGSRKPRVEKEDTDEDDLSEDRIIEARLRTRDKKTTFQKNLEKLKRKKQGKPPISSSEEEDDDISQASGSDDEAQPFKGAKKTEDTDSEHNSLFDEDSEENFIIEDDGDGSALLPMEFRSQQDLAHHFKTIFQFFVHVAVCLPVERREFMEKQSKDEYFSVPLHTARRKIEGLRDSSVASSVWRPEFKKSLEALPKFDLFQLEFSVPDCDACHLGSRVSTLQGRLGGAPYDRVGFQEELDSDDDSDAESSKKKKKKKKSKKRTKQKPEKSKYIDTLHLGRFCAKRTRVYHDLSHWEYHLFKRIEDEVDDLHAAEQDNGYVRVAWAGGRMPPKDLDDADGICEWLDQRQIIDREWQKLRKLMESATQLDIAVRKGEGDVD